MTEQSPRSSCVRSLQTTFLCSSKRPRLCLFFISRPPQSPRTWKRALSPTHVDLTAKKMASSTLGWVLFDDRSFQLVKHHREHDEASDERPLPECIDSQS